MSAHVKHVILLTSWFHFSNAQHVWASFCSCTNSWMLLAKVAYWFFYILVILFFITEFSGKRLHLLL